MRRFVMLLICLLLVAAFAAGEGTAMPDMQVITENTVKWAEEHLGSTAYTTLCLAFIEDALEKSNHIEIFGGDCAKESADLYKASENTGEPPRGAFVFYDWQGLYNGNPVNWGHCGISLGDGSVIHAWDRVRIDNYLDMEKLPSPPGGTPLRYIGWVPLETVMTVRMER